MCLFFTTGEWFFQILRRFAAYLTSTRWSDPTCPRQAVTLSKSNEISTPRTEPWSPSAPCASGRREPPNSSSESWPWSEKMFRSWESKYRPRGTYAVGRKSRRVPVPNRAWPSWLSNQSCRCCPPGPGVRNVGVEPLGTPTTIPTTSRSNRSLPGQKGSRGWRVRVKKSLLILSAHSYALTRRRGVVG